jgi:hypothetical protein
MMNLKSNNPFCVIERNGLYINLLKNIALAKEHNPEVDPFWKVL